MPKESEVQLAYEAAQAVVTVHRRLAEWLRVGVTLAQIDTFVAGQLDDLGCKSCFYRYNKVKGLPPFPSFACLGVNDCVVHGTAAYYEHPLKPGDLLKVDIGVTRRGWIGDAGWTYAFKAVPPEVKRLMECGKESLRRGVLALRPGTLLLEWARAVQTHVEDECGFHLVRGLGGHGYRRDKLHEKPFVSNVMPETKQEWPEGFEYLRPGMFLAVEPMIGMTSAATHSDPRKWPVFIADGSPSVHYEHDVLITPEGPRVLSHGLDELPEFVG